MEGYTHITDIESVQKMLDKAVGICFCKTTVLLNCETNVIILFLGHHYSIITV